MKSLVFELMQEAAEIGNAVASVFLMQAEGESEKNKLANAFRSLMNEHKKLQDSHQQAMRVIHLRHVADRVLPLEKIPGEKV